MDVTSSAKTASDMQMDFMHLLVTQLQNQNPLEPLDNQEMAAQLAQFSQLDQLETMNTSFCQVLASMQRAYAGSLIGKEVAYAGTTEDGSAGTGTVEQVQLNREGDILLNVTGQAVRLEDVLSIKNKQ